ncbi:GtrA family protein [Frateuria edaphi]|uniref:GtrA family protein n=1 Tax=Frateuria edaphi TaxID=2898793 RepID=UPI001E618C4B|nr:GtrA family protein [Frateuria edaphi]UGB44994.1 GtrA family protein [Frateuria edaphi]
MKVLATRRPANLIRLFWLDQRIRFLAVGAWNTVAGYGIFVLVHLLIARRVGDLLVIVIAYMIALPLAFYMQRRFVFNHGTRWLVSFRRFVLANSLIFFSNLVFLPLFVRFTGIGPLVSQAIFVSFSTIVSYVAHKHYSFSR